MFLGLQWNNAQKGNGHKWVLYVLAFAVLVFASRLEAAFAQSSSCPGIHINILMHRIMCFYKELFNADEDSGPFDPKRPAQIQALSQDSIHHGRLWV